MSGRWRSISIGVAAAVAAALPRDLAAHKPITSPYTFNEDVLPIVRARCGACHVAGGVAPMSLMTPREAVPWGESIRTELIAGHMPPWRVESAAARFRNASGLTARELNILMTWVTGGTPPGAPAVTEAAADAGRTWRGGPPDLVLKAEAPFTLAADRQEQMAEFRLQTRLTERRWIRGVDLLPGNPAIVRSATLSIDSPPGSSPASAGRNAPAPQRILSLWLPGDPMVALEGAAIELPAGAALTLRVRYRKTWEHEHEAMSDLSQVGLYFAAAAAPPVRALTLSAGSIADASAGGDVVTFSQVVDRDLQALAIYPDAALEGAGVRVTATAPGGPAEELIAFHPPVGWQRRYWFAAPIALPHGTRLDVRARFNDTTALLPPGATPRPHQDPSPARVRLTLDVIEP